MMAARDGGGGGRGAGYNNRRGGRGGQRHWQREEREGGGRGQNEHGGRQHRDQDRRRQNPQGHGGEHRQQGGGGREQNHQGEGGRPYERRVGPVRYWSRDEIDQISKLSSAAVIQRIQEEEGAFVNAFTFSKNYESKYTLVRLIRILNALCNCTEEGMDFSSRKLSQVLSDCSGFLMKLKSFLSTTDDATLLQNTVKIFQFCVERIPMNTIFRLPHSELKETVEDLEGHTHQSLKKLFEDYCQLYDRKRGEVRKLRKEEQQRSTNNNSFQKVPSDLQKLHDLPPPNDFREIEILPQAKEFTLRAEKPFLRPVIITDSYQSWDHYLDVQFRLLREDFMSPLRDGINEYLTSNESTKNVHIYLGARVLRPVCLFTGIGFQVKFDIHASRLNRVKWEHSRRLIYGSLLCLSSDHFRTFFFATVVKRDAEDLKEGVILLKFEDGKNGFAIDPGTSFTMVESTAYFEAYRHVLEGLQQIAPDQMPFTQHIIQRFDKTNPSIPLPLCIRNNSSFDLNQVLEVKRPIGKIDVKEWSKSLPSICLDPSQLIGFKMALSQELSIIQGPPGTGKTYVGLKILQALLLNRSVWDPRSNSPILVVCYTNHALDQFLDGIIDCQLEKSRKPKIVRVGGRCKSEKIKECAMANLVSTMKKNREVPGNVYRKVREDRNTMKVLSEEMNKHLGAIDAMEGKILTTDDIQEVLDRRFHEQLLYGQPEEIPEQKHLEVWLELWYLPAANGQQAHHEMTEDEQLAAAMEASLQIDQPGMGTGLEENTEIVPENDQGGGIEIDGAAFIDVVDEPQILEQERMTEGELIELGHNGRDQQQPRLLIKDPQKEKATEEGGWDVVQLKPKERKKRIANGMRHQPMTDREAGRVIDLWRLTIKDRWRLYQYWLIQYIRKSKAKLKLFGEKYDRHAQECTETDRQLNTLTLSGADIIGMTTTGAAKHSYIFKHFHPKIVIVEEAAEVLESHVITSLCGSVQQLILIGDHKQLQPKITCFKLEKNYNLHVSLFERLAMKEYPIATLGVQHRMRPEIAAIVGTHIYDKLENHESVLSYDHVKGIGKDLYFIEHCQLEKANPTGDQRSHANPFEAQYVAALTRYLLKQGYSPGEITILTMYRGQLFEIKHNMKREEFEGVRVTAVDDFQGEENEIVIISLVRSNSDNSIGFLKVANRICVSLSRARKGMYVIGNFAMLRDKKDTKWPAILEQMDRGGNLGGGLPLCCQIHSEEKVVAKTPQDFSKSPEGGCKRSCGVRLNCGHVCSSPCHPLDREHKSLYQCHQKCSKQLPCGHKCNRRCTECLDGCGPCEINTSRRLPTCGHEVRMKCCENLFMFKCHRPCNKFIPECGHKCQNLCYQPCTHHNACQTLVTQRLACTHMVKKPCSADSVVCTEPCRKTLDKCGDQCTGTCGTCSQGRLHVKCKKKCGRSLNCGHICDFPCPDYCPPCSKLCRNYCFHSKCPKKCYEPCVPCREPCKWECRHYKCTTGCGEMCDRPRCNRPCGKRIKKCDHLCIGLCGEDCPTLCRICDKDEVTEIFFGEEDEEGARFIQLKDCSHVFEVSGLDTWMDTQKGDQAGESNLIKFVECPKCKTPIRRSLRYGNIIKATINDMEQVKKLNLRIGGTVSPRELLNDAEVVKSNEIVQKVSPVKEVCQMVCDRVNTAITSAKPNVPPLLPHEINTIQNQLSLLPALARLFMCLYKLNTKRCQIASQIIHVPTIVKEAKKLLGFLKTAVDRDSYLSPQQAEDAECELRRLFCISRICEIKYNATKEKRQFNADDEKALEENIWFYIRCGVSTPRANGGDQAKTDTLLETVRHKYSIGGLSASEKAQIRQAMSDIQRGAWYSCPKGHIYAIGECGGATEVGQCPECGSRIGGTDHRLTEGNTHASEMDGSQHAAWSEAANLGNFDPQQLNALFH